MRYWLGLLILLFVPNLAAASTYYVSKNGSNAAGTSWSTAWNELSNINWGVVNPGDTIYIDGGSTACQTPNNTYNPQTKQYGLRPGFSCGMRYESTLAIGKSGTSTSPITIKLSTETGRNGTAVIFGGRTAPLGYCGDTAYVAIYNSFSGVRTQGISMNNKQYVTLDGTKWGGITVYGHNNYGISLGTAANNQFRYLELYDNGNFNTSSVYPDQEGVTGLGSNSLFDHVLIHDNGQDSFQTGGGGVSGPDFNLTIRNSWLYISRTDGADSRAFNYCRHADGIQVYGGGEKSGITIENSIFGPNFMQGVILGAPLYNGIDGPNTFSTIHNVTIRNSLFYGNHNANIINNVTPYIKPRNWLIENVTSDRVTDEQWGNFQIIIDPAQITVRNSITTGGLSHNLPVGGNYSGNFLFWFPSPSYYPAGFGTLVDPRYAQNTHGSLALNANFTLAANSPSLGKGSPITSSTQLLGTIPGDLNSDAKVDLADLQLVIANFNLFTFNSVVANYGRQ